MLWRSYGSTRLRHLVDHDVGAEPDVLDSGDRDRVVEVVEPALDRRLVEAGGERLPSCRPRRRARRSAQLLVGELRAMSTTARQFAVRDDDVLGPDGGWR